MVIEAAESAAQPRRRRQMMKERIEVAVFGGILVLGLPAIILAGYVLAA